MLHDGMLCITRYWAPAGALQSHRRCLVVLGFAVYATRLAPKSESADNFVVHLDCLAQPHKLLLHVVMRVAPAFPQQQVHCVQCNHPLTAYSMLLRRSKNTWH